MLAAVVKVAWIVYVGDSTMEGPPWPVIESIGFFLSFFVVLDESGWTQQVSIFPPGFQPVNIPTASRRGILGLSGFLFFID